MYIQKQFKLKYISFISVNFKNILKNLLQQYNIPLEELENFDEVADLLYDQKMEALQHIKEVLIPDDYKLFRKAFIEHPQLNNIWKTRKYSTDTIQENNLFNEFKRELQLLWELCQVDNTVDFEHVAQ